MLWHVGPYMRDQRAKDAAIAAIAARQHGVVTASQLANLGLDKRGILRRAHAGRLHRVHPRIYAVGHRALSQEGRWMAAVLSYGAEAVLSHRSAAKLWSMLPSAPGPIEVLVPGVAGRRKRAAIRIHRSTTLSADQVTRRRNIPVTTPARTIADLRRVAPALAQKALRQAAVIGLQVPEEVEVDHTRSELEGQFLRLCRRHRLPPPEVNVPVGPFLVDFLWRAQRLIVETDGYRYHRGRQAFEDDRARDVKLRRWGYEVLRVSHRQVAQQRDDLAMALKEVLGHI